MYMYVTECLRRFIFRCYRNRVIKKHELNYLFWECTLRCNLNCKHCGSDCLKTSDVEDMPLEDFVQVLDDIKQNNTSRHLTVCITGGEPLLRTDLEKAGKQIVKRGFNWGIVTNALAFTPERFASLLKSGMTSISFSLDGLKEQHTALRKNPCSFERTVNAIKTVVKFQKDNPGYFAFDVITCVHKNNLEELPVLRNFLIELGVERWRIFSIFPSGRAAENNLALSGREYVRLMEFIKETRKYKDKKGKGIRLNYACEGFLGKYELKVRDYYFFCRGGINVGSVMCDGNVSACLSVRGKDFIQGNIYHRPFMQIWNEEYKNLRNRNWAKKGRCALCKEWKNCLGNGLHLYNSMSEEPAHCNLQMLADIT
ncbi:MAG: radical SAM protein [Treponema sp.]|nr:radical SAM protein [Treponema sp.]